MRFNLRLERQKVFNVSVVVLLAALFLASYRGGGDSAPLTPTVSAQGAATVPWTAVASTGSMDESSLNFYAFGTTDLGFAGGGGQQLLARYNVTNTYDNSPFGPNIPGWRTLELGSTAGPGSVVVADLWRVERCTGQRILLCRAFNAGGGGPRCDFCQLPASVPPIDFTAALYYVELRLFRTPGSAGPRAFTLRVF